MKKMTAMAAALAGLILGASGARAEGRENGPCRQDVEKFCKDVKPGEGRIINCLKQHEGELSAACREKGGKMKEAAGQGKEACQEDLDKFCKDVQPGEGRLINCLKQHEGELSAKCKAFHAEKKEERSAKMDKVKTACQGDLQQFCKDVQPGEGRLINCLKEHKASLSAGCQEAASGK